MTGVSPFHMRNWGTHQISSWCSHTSKVMVPRCTPHTHTLGSLIYVPCLPLPWELELLLCTLIPSAECHVLVGRAHSFFLLLLSWYCVIFCQSECPLPSNAWPTGWDGPVLVGPTICRFPLPQILVIPKCMSLFWSYVAAKLNLWAKHGYRWDTRSPQFHLIEFIECSRLFIYQVFIGNLL